MTSTVIRTSTTIGILALAMAAGASANTATFESLEQFCLASGVDTAENCACGQKTADELLTPEEQKLVLGMMLKDPQAMAALMQQPDQGRSLMEKVQKITRGCG